MKIGDLVMVTCKFAALRSHSCYPYGCVSGVAVVIDLAVTDCRDQGEGLVLHHHGLGWVDLEECEVANETR